jgi:CBS-domain-containing membrane protein
VVQAERGVEQDLTGVHDTNTTDGLGGLWLALIGLFLVNAASAEEQHARMSGRLGGLTVNQVMSSPAITAGPDQTVERFLHEVALVQRFSTYPLVDAFGSLTGLVTLNRLRSVDPSARAFTPLRDVACPLSEVPIARPDEPLTALLPRLAECSDGRAVVVDGGRVVGVVSPSDISRTLQLVDLAVFDPYPAGGAGADVARALHPTPR